jgi:hypothetical protein
MSCAYDKERLTGYFDGELDAPEKADVERHISACSECLRDLGEIKSAALLVRELPRERAPLKIAQVVSREVALAGRVNFFDRARKGAFWVLAAAAGVLVVATVLIFEGAPSGEPARLARSAEKRDSSALSVSPAEAPAPDPAPAAAAPRAIERKEAQEFGRAPEKGMAARKEPLERRAAEKQLDPRSEAELASKPESRRPAPAPTDGKRAPLAEELDSPAKAEAKKPEAAKKAGIPSPSRPPETAPPPPPAPAAPSAPEPALRGGAGLAGGEPEEVAYTLLTPDLAGARTRLRGLLDRWGSSYREQAATAGKNRGLRDEEGSLLLVLTDAQLSELRATLEQQPGARLSLGLPKQANLAVPSGAAAQELKQQPGPAPVERSKLQGANDAALAKESAGKNQKAQNEGNQDKDAPSLTDRARQGPAAAPAPPSQNQATPQNQAPTQNQATQQNQSTPSKNQGTLPGGQRNAVEPQRRILLYLVPTSADPARPAPQK